MEVLLTLQDFLHMESTVIEDIRGEIGRREEGGDTNCAHLYTHEYTSFINRLGVIY